MSSGRKITDLERLTKPGGKVLPDDDTIPVLTERLSLPSLDLDVSLPESASPEAATPEEEDAKTTAFPIPTDAPVDVEATLAPTAAPAADAKPPPPAPEVTIDWVTVEEQAREALLRELQSRLASELDRQLRERLQPTLVRMLLATVTELRPSIEAAVRESVTRAVAAEVARQRSRE
ncbi:MAG TPA: hypothetical protein VFN64_10225 [Burkholderiaceae bacterium]|nr:hypothetical protein [Burkholderiaceae bacterium]